MVHFFGRQNLPHPQGDLIFEGLHYLGEAGLTVGGGDSTGNCRGQNSYDVWVYIFTLLF